VIKEIVNKKYIKTPISNDYVILKKVAFDYSK
jgi:hypothetical protein